MLHKISKTLIDFQILDLGRRLSGKPIRNNISQKRELSSMKPATISPRSYRSYNNEERSHTNNEKQKDAHLLSNSFECDIIKDKTIENEPLRNQNSTRDNSSGNSVESKKLSKTGGQKIDPPSFLPLNKDTPYSNCNDIVTANSKPQTSVVKTGNRKKGNRRASRDPPPRPPRQKQPSTLPLDGMKKQRSHSERHTIVNEMNLTSPENNESQNVQSVVSKKHIMSPLSSCPNIYGNVRKKDHVTNKPLEEENEKPISLISSELHLFETESQGQNEVSNHRKILKLEDIMTPCILKPITTTLATNADHRHIYNQPNMTNNDNEADYNISFPASVGIESMSYTTSQIRMLRNPTKHTPSSSSSCNTQDHCSIPMFEDPMQSLSLVHQNSFQNVNDGKIHSSEKLFNDIKRHQSVKRQTEDCIENDTNNLFSTSRSSSANSVVYKKCKLCDKCSQKFGHSNKGVGTRGETTLI